MSSKVKVWDQSCYVMQEQAKGLELQRSPGHNRKVSPGLDGWLLLIPAGKFSYRTASFSKAPFNLPNKHRSWKVKCCVTKHLFGSLQDSHGGSCLLQSLTPLLVTVCFFTKSANRRLFCVSVGRPQSIQMFHLLIMTQLSAKSSFIMVQLPLTSASTLLVSINKI